MTPKLSVVIPTRNSPSTVRRALESIRQQDFEDYEVLVMDDGSTADVQGQYRSRWGEFDDRLRLDLPPLPNLPGQRQSATRRREIPETVIDGVSGWLVPPADPPELNRVPARAKTVLRSWQFAAFAVQGRFSRRFTARRRMWYTGWN